jgi:ribosomal subunit interface protein
MQVEMKVRGIPSSPELRSFVERRLGFALDRHEERVAGVRVTLEDVNGPKGGRDKSCQVHVRLRGGQTVRATAQDADFHAAADIAVHRVARGVNRAVERLRAAPPDPRKAAQHDDVPR